MAGKSDETRSLEMRGAELEDKLQQLHITEDELKAYHKVASALGGGAGPGAGAGAAAALSAGAAGLPPVDCVINRCTIAQTCVRACTIRACTIRACTIRACTVISQCIQECINECGPGLP